MGAAHTQTGVMAKVGAGDSAEELKGEDQVGAPIGDSQTMAKISDLDSFF